MPLLADSLFWGLMLLLGVVMAIVILIRRSRRLLSKQGDGSAPVVHVPRAQSGWSSSASHGSDELIRQEVELHEQARDLAGMLDSKIGILQHLIAQSQQQIERLETLLERAERATGDASTPSDGNSSAGSSSTDRAADDTGGVREDLDPQLAEIFQLADQGFSIATIAHRVGLPLAEVETVLQDRASRELH